jgi:hypothetical protein
MMVLGFALLLYFSRNGLLREAARSSDLFVVGAMLVVVVLISFASLTPMARVFINRHGKLILKIGIAMFLFSLLSPIVLLCGILLIKGNSERLLPYRYFEILFWGNAAIGFCGILAAMIPARSNFSNIFGRQTSE